MIIIQKEDIEFEKIIYETKNNKRRIGAISTFIGFVRDFSVQPKEELNHLEIEHYEGMTQKALQEIEKSALQKWDLIETRIIHRVGKIKLNEPIVFILVASKHRDNAFDACRFIIDYLKTEAPFWKKEVAKNKSKWVKQKKSDLKKVVNLIK